MRRFNPFDDWITPVLLEICHAHYTVLHVCKGSLMLMHFSMLTFYQQLHFLNTGKWIEEIWPFWANVKCLSLDHSNSMRMFVIFFVMYSFMLVEDLLCIKSWVIEVNILNTDTFVCNFSWTSFFPLISVSANDFLERPLAGSQVPFCPMDKKVLNSWSHIEPCSFKVRGDNYFR